MSAASDAAWMRLALEHAATQRGVSSPNPAVGAVLVRDGTVVGTGTTSPVGGPHAEINAIAAAGDAARGATLYVTMEPCSHHGRTPPCCDAVIAAGIERVVCGIIDPNPVVQGRGVAALAAAGMPISVGIEEVAARAHHAPFIVRQREGRPMLTLKLATSLDGRAATRTGESQWITGAEAREQVHGLRAQADAVLVGTGTLLADDPALTARRSGQLAARQPLRVVLDRQLRAPLTRRVFDTADARTLVFCGLGADHSKQVALRDQGVQVVEVPEVAGQLALASIVAHLATLPLLEVFYEGGPTLAGALADAGLVDRVHWFVAPFLIGGRDAGMGLGGDGLSALGAARAGRITRNAQVGGDVWLTAELSPHLLSQVAMAPLEG